MMLLAWFSYVVDVFECHCNYTWYMLTCHVFWWDPMTSYHHSSFQNPSSMDFWQDLQNNRFWVTLDIFKRQTFLQSASLATFLSKIMTDCNHSLMKQKITNFVSANVHWNWVNIYWFQASESLTFVQNLRHASNVKRMNVVTNWWFKHVQNVTNIHSVTKPLHEQHKDQSISIHVRKTYNMV